jgi:hypothetical protein
VAPIGAKQAEDKGTAEVIGDLWQLVRDYAKQETIDPLKSIGRFLGYGLAGAVLLGLGTLFAVLAILRGLQTETGAHLTGSWDWVPYLVAFVLSGAIVAVAVRAITRPGRNDRARP